MRIGIIKLGAKGDVIRTLSILPAIKKKFPECEIHWITRKNISDILSRAPYIDKIHETPLVSNLSFDILYNLDFDEEATSLAEKISAEKKLGFRAEAGFPASYNFGAEEYLNTMFDDDLKKNNKKTYQELIFKASDLEYQKEFCGLNLRESDRDYGNRFKKENNLPDKIIGIHMGAGPRWPSKAWHPERVREFIELANSKGFKTIIFGGPDEVESHKRLISQLQSKGIRIFHNNPENTNLEFASLINLCDYVVCSDSFALHVSTALQKKVIALFFCTSPNEVEDYGLIQKISSPMLYDFFPERMNEYDEDLVRSISAGEVIHRINSYGKE